MCNFNRHLNCDTALADWIDEGKVFQRIIARFANTNYEGQ